jgi:2-dehydropantoate 2-reductase
MATLTSAGDLVVGDIFASPELTQLFDMLSDELALVAKADGCDVTAALNGMRSQLPSLPHFTSSMNRDFRAGRRVELEWLTGAFVRMARQKQIPVPAHFTLYALLKRKAQGVSQGPVQGT